MIATTVAIDGFDACNDAGFPIVDEIPINIDKNHKNAIEIPRNYKKFIQVSSTYCEDKHETQLSWPPHRRYK